MVFSLKRDLSHDKCNEAKPGIIVSGFLVILIIINDTSGILSSFDLPITYSCVIITIDY